MVKEKFSLGAREHKRLNVTDFHYATNECCRVSHEAFSNCRGTGPQSSHIVLHD
jgi:hypothetical protein